MLESGQQIELAELAAGLGVEGTTFAVGRLIRGGMGLCAEVVHVETGAHYALKLVLPRHQPSYLSFQRFAQEVKLWNTAASCEAVVEVYTTFRINESPCVCAKWMDGGDLSEYLQRRDTEFFYVTVDRVLSGLEYVYEHFGIIHRDMKPQNILLDGEDRAYICDWGIGRAISAAYASGSVGSLPARPAASVLTATGSMMGTIYYCAPEQILNAKAADFRADIYSVGCMLYEWEEGRPPFLGASPEEVAYAHLEHAPPRLGGFLKKTDFGADKVISQCLAKTPSDRYETYAHLRRALADCAAKRGVRLPLLAATKRFSSPVIGAREVQRYAFKGMMPVKTGHALVKRSELEPYIREAEVLCSVGEWQKAYDIFHRCYVPDAITACPDLIWNQGIAVGVGLCLVNMRRPAEAVAALNTIKHAKHRPAEYFVNLSLALLMLMNFKGAEAIAREGVDAYPDDLDLLGNLTNALSLQNNAVDALPVAKRRLSIRRDVHSLEEMANVRMALAEPKLFTEFPSALDDLGTAIHLFAEACRINPQYLVTQYGLARALFLIWAFSASCEQLKVLAPFKAWGEIRAGLFAECMNRSGIAKECVEFCDRHLADYPTSVRLQRVRAETIADAIVFGTGEDDVRALGKQCIRFFSEIVLDEKQRQMSDFLFLGRLYDRLGHSDQALVLINEAISIQANEWEVPFAKASVYWGRKEFGRALHFAEIACTKAPWHPPVWRLISMVQFSQGNRTEADVSDLRAKRLSLRKNELVRAAIPKTGVLVEEVRAKFSLDFPSLSSP